MHSSDKRATNKGLALALVFCACSSKPAQTEPLVGISGPAAQTSSSAIEFELDSLDARPVSGQALRGRPAVITFVKLGNLGSQAQMNFLVAMAKHDEDKIGYAMVALEARDQRELVELYRKTLNVTFPVAMADAATLAGAGPFGAMPMVPVTVVLDRAGRISWRADGRVAKSEELREHLKGL
jgi:hypothetical protein